MGTAAMDFFNQHLNQDFSGMDMDEFNAGDLPMNEDELSALLQPIEQYGTPFGQSTPGAETSPRNDGQGDDGQGVDGQGDAGQHQGNDGHHHHEGDPAQAGQDENMPDVDPYLSFGYSPYPTPQASQQEPNSDAAMMPSPAKWEEKHECGGATAQYTIAATPASTVDDDEQAPQGAGDGQHVGTPVQQYTIAATPASTQGGDEDTSQDEVQKTPRPVSPWFAGEDQHVATPVQQYTIATTPASTQADDEDTAQDTAQDDVQKTPQPAAPKSGPSLDTIVEAPASPPAEHDGPVAKDQEMKDNVDYPTPQPVDLMMTPLPSHDMGTPGGPQYTVAQTPASSDDDASTIRAASPPAETHALQDAHVHEAPIDRDEEMQKDEQTASQEEHHQAADNVPTHQGGAATPPAEEDTHDDAASESTGLFVTDHPSLVEQVPSPPASESSGLFVPDHPPAVEQEAHTPVSELAGRFAGNGQHPAEAFASTPGAPASEMTGLFVNDEQPPAEPPVPEQPAARPPAQDVPEQPVAHPPAQAAPVSSAHPLVVSWCKLFPGLGTSLYQC